MPLPWVYSLGSMTCCAPQQYTLTQGSPLFPTPQEGRKEGQQETLLETIRNLMANMKWTEDQAMSAMSIPADHWGFYKERLYKYRILGNLLFLHELGSIQMSSL